MKIGTKVKSTRDMYYVSPDDIYEDFYTKEEIMSMCSQIISTGDVYELKTDDWECIEGSMLGELSEGWFEMRVMIEKGVFEVIE